MGKLSNIGIGAGAGSAVSAGFGDPITGAIAGAIGGSLLGGSDDKEKPARVYDDPTGEAGDVLNKNKAMDKIAKLWRKTAKGGNQNTINKLTRQLNKEKFGISNNEGLSSFIADLTRDAGNARDSKFSGGTMDQAYNSWYDRAVPALTEGGWQFADMFPNAAVPPGSLGSGGNADINHVDFTDPDFSYDKMLSGAATVNDIGIPMPDYLSNGKMGESEMRSAIMTDKWNSTLLNQINKNKGAGLLAQGLRKYDDDPVNAGLTSAATDLIKNPFSQSDADFEATMAAGEEPLIGAEASGQRAIAENMAGRGMDPNSPLAAALSSNMRFKRLQGQGDVRRQAGLDRSTRKRQELLQALQAAGQLSGQQAGVQANYRGNIANILGGLGANSVTAGLESWPNEMFQNDMAQQQMDMAKKEAEFGWQDAVGMVGGLADTAVSAYTGGMV